MVSSGYLSDVDTEAAAYGLEDALFVAAAEYDQDTAADDYATKQDIVTEVEV